MEGWRLTRSSAAALAAACCLIACSASVSSSPGVASGLRQSAQALVDVAFKADGPGGTVIVMKDGAAVFRAARGMANIELEVPLRPDSILRIGSVTKQFTSAAVMMLVEQGRLSLDDDITKFVPDYPTGGRHISIEHLLTHTSGIKSYTGMSGWRAAWGRDFTTAELIDFFKKEPMEFEPGERYRYNNSAYFLLGAVIEKVGGLPFGDFLARNIFGPLGMSSTRHGDTAPILQRRAQGYVQDAAGFVNAPYLSMTQPGAAGALVSTVEDLARWDAAVSAGRLLSPASWQRIFTPYRLKSGRSTGYGFGWQVGVFDGRPVHEHGGGINGFSAYVVRLPEDHVYVAVLANWGNANTGSLARRLAALAAGKPLVNPEPLEMEASALREYAGVYDFEGDKVMVTLTDGLNVQAPDSPAARILPMARDAFFVRDSFSRFTFQRDPAGRITGLTRTAWGGVQVGRRTSEPLPPPPPR